jgi:hypothetical protein
MARAMIERSYHSRHGGGGEALLSVRWQEQIGLRFGLALLALLVWFLAAHEQQIRVAISGRDSTIYWASGKLLSHGENPYSGPAVLALERSQGYTAEKQKMLCPAWSTWIVLPLGLLSAYWAWVAWLAILLASLMISVRVVWRMYGDGPTPPFAFLLTAYIFAPIAMRLVLVQRGIALLLGVAIFLLLAESRPFQAGMALLLPW